MNMSVGEIAELVHGTVVGDSTAVVRGVNGIREAREGELSFVSEQEYLPLLKQTKATAVLVCRDVKKSCTNLIQVDNPRLAAAVLMRRIEEQTILHPKGIHPTAVIGRNVVLGQRVALDAHVCIGDDCIIDNGVILYAGVYVGHSCTIGQDSVVYPNATLRERTRVGARCVIHSGAVVGSDGFGFTPGAKGLEKIPQLGTVEIGDDVEVGANSAVDRATFGATVIGQGTKIDNLVQIGHNVQIGCHTVVCGNVGIAGSSVVGDRVTLGAGAGITGHIEIGDNATVAGYSGVSKSVKPGEVVFGYPAVEHTRGKRMHAALRLLPETLREFRALQKRVAELEGMLNGKTEDNR